MQIIKRSSVSSVLFEDRSLTVAAQNRRFRAARLSLSKRCTQVHNCTARVVIRAVCITLLAGYACIGQAPPQLSPGVQALLRDAHARIREITPAQLRAMMDSASKPVLIDIREESEWQAGQAAAAIHVGRGVLELRIERAVPAKDTLLVLYCASGIRSALAADTLQKIGYTRVFSLAGGFNAYRLAGLPVQK
jgi:rhodanese-related sulfurtransferase